eukprot:1032892-Pelagomonas_calceolata.AAC.3
MGRACNGAALRPEGRRATAAAGGACANVLLRGPAQMCVCVCDPGAKVRNQQQQAHRSSEKFKSEIEFNQGT